MPRKLIKRKCHGGYTEDNYGDCDFCDEDTGVCLYGGDECEFYDVYED